MIHDDVEDYSEERRGKQCFHRIYGVPLTVNTGDALHISMAEKCTTGQSKELEWIEMKKWNVTEEDYYEMAKRKHHGTQSQLHAGLVQ